MIEKKTKIMMTLALIGCCAIGAGILLGVNKSKEKDDLSTNDKSYNLDGSLKKDEETKVSSSEVYNLENNNIIYFGDFKIEKVVGESGATAYTEEGKNKIIGGVLHFSKDVAKYNNIKCNNPIYKETKISVEEFCKNNNIKKDTLNLKESEIIEVHITSKDGEWDTLGNTLILTRNGILVKSGGVFFSLKKI